MKHKRSAAAHKVQEKLQVKSKSRDEKRKQTKKNVKNQVKSKRLVKKLKAATSKKSTYSKYCSDTDEENDKKVNNVYDDYDEYEDEENAEERSSNKSQISSSDSIEFQVESNTDDDCESITHELPLNDMDISLTDDTSSTLPILHIPESSDDLLIKKDLLLDCLSVYEVLRQFSSALRLSPFIFEDFTACLMTNENNSLYSEIHMSLIKILLKEDEQNQIVFGASDVKSVIDVAFHLMDAFTWPEILRQYIESDCQVDKRLIFILSNQNYPLVSVSDKLYVLNSLCNLFLSTSFAKNDLSNEKSNKSDDYCRVCHKLGNLLCCETCPATYHLNCLDPPLQQIPDDEWICSICQKHQVKGALETSHSVFRQIPLGYDRLRRKYWFMCRRLFVEDAHFKCTHYYSCKLQVDYLLSKLDGEQYEVNLVKNILKKYDHIISSMKITQELTDERKFMKKSYLDDLNDQLMRYFIENKINLPKENKLSSEVDGDQIQINDDSHSELDESHQVDGIVDRDESKTTATANNNQQSLQLVKILKLNSTFKIQQSPSTSSSLLKKLVNGTNEVESVQERQVQSISLNDERFKLANIINKTKNKINLNLSKTPIAPIQLQSDASNVLRFVSNLKPIINLEQNDNVSQSMQQQPTQIVLYKLGMESNYRLYDNQYASNSLTMNRSQHTNERDRKNILSRRFFVNVDFTWKSNIHSNYEHLAKALAQTILHIESLISPAFMHHLWSKYRDKWIKCVKLSRSIHDFIQVLMRLESVMKPFLFIGAWRDSVGYVRIHKETVNEKEERKREEKRRVMLHLSSYQNYIAENPDMPQTYARFTRGLKHTIYKQKGEEYRLSGQGGWYWHSNTRRSQTCKPHKKSLTDEMKQKYREICKSEQLIQDPSEPWTHASLHPYLQSLNETQIDLNSSIFYPKKSHHNSKLNTLLEYRLKAQEEIRMQFERILKLVHERLVDDEIDELNRTAQVAHDKNDSTLREKIFTQINDEKRLEKLLKQTDKGDYAVTIKNDTFKFPSNPHTSKKFKLKLVGATTTQSHFPPVQKFSFNGKRSIFILNRDQLRVIAKNGGFKVDIPGFKVENVKFSPTWPYMCGRPVLRTTWLFRTHTACNLSSLALQLRYLYTCIRWDAVNERPPISCLTSNGDAILTETFDDCIQTTDVLKRRDIGAYQFKTEYFVRKKRTSLMPTKVPKIKKIKKQISTPSQQQRQSSRRSARHSIKKSFIDDSDSDENETTDDMSRSSSSNVDEYWVTEESLHLWQIKGFFEKQKRFELEQQHIRTMKSSQSQYVSTTPRPHQKVVVNPNVQNLSMIRPQVVTPIMRTNNTTTTASNTPIVVTKILQTTPSSSNCLQIIRTPINLSNFKVINPSLVNGNKIIRLISSNQVTNSNQSHQILTNIKTAPIRSTPKSVAQLLTLNQTHLQSPVIQTVSQEQLPLVSEEAVPKLYKKSRKAKVILVENEKILRETIVQEIERIKKHDLLEKHKEQLKRVIAHKKEIIHQDMCDSIKHEIEYDCYLEWKKAGFPPREQLKEESKIEIAPVELMVKLEAQSDDTLNKVLHTPDEVKHEERPNRKRKLSVKLNDSILTDTQTVPPLKIKLPKVESIRVQDEAVSLEEKKPKRLNRKKCDMDQLVEHLQPRQKQRDDLYCLCKKPYDNRLFYIGCDKCQDWFHGSCVGILPLEASSLETYKCPNCVRSEGKEWPLEREITRENHEFIAVALSQIKKHRMAWPFVDQVDPREVPNYYEIIKEPMDLSMIESRFKSNYYRNYVDLIHDFSMILENCRLFNVADSKFCKCADAIERLFVDKLKILKSKL